MGCPVTPLRNLTGHALPGIIFLVFGLIILNGIFRRYFLCLRERHFDPTNGRHFRSSLIYPLTVAPNIPLVAIIITVCSTFGFFTELVQFVPHCYGLHVMLYISFGMVSLFEIFRFYKFPIPEGTEMLMSLLANVVDVVLLMQHLIETPMKNRFHMNLILIQVGGACFIVAEMANRHNALLSIAKLVFMSLLGTWYITIGLIINKYVLPDLETDPHFLVRIQLIFVSQIYVVVLLAAIIGAYQNKIIKLLTPEEVTAALDLDFEGELTKNSDGGKIKYSNDCKRHIHYSRLSEETG